MRNLFIICIMFVGGTTSAQTLQQHFKKYFQMGAAISAAQITGTDAVGIALVNQHFNTYTPENVMKAEIIHPRWHVYDFQLADQLVAWAQRNHAAVNGHTLIWHSQLSPFAKAIHDKDSFQLFFKEHIQTIAKHFDGKMASWDVVNEALEEDGSMRRSIFYSMLGPDYVMNAFRLAQEAAPKTELYYNDYNIEMPAKRAGCIALIQQLQKEGIRVDGVGIQGHWKIGQVPFNEIEESIIAYAALGIKVMFTELDIDVLPRDFSGADVSKKLEEQPAFNPYATAIPDSILQQQADDYAQLFALFKKYAGKVTRVTLWGVHDGQSWLNGWPVKGRTNYPLLFDRKGNPKPAFIRIVKNSSHSYLP